MKIIQTLIMCGMQRTYIRKTPDAIHGSHWVQTFKCMMCDVTALTSMSKAKKTLWHQSAGGNQNCHLLESSNSQRAEQKEFSALSGLVVNYIKEVFFFSNVLSLLTVASKKKNKCAFMY